jgi:hypothetical protein
MWNGLDVDFLEPMQPNPTSYEWNWLAIDLSWVGLSWVELSWVELPTKKKEQWQVSEQAWAHNNCLTRESTLLYPKVAAQIALFTSPLGYRIARTPANCNGCVSSTYPTCLSGLHPFDLSMYICHMS